MRYSTSTIKKRAEKDNPYQAIPKGKWVDPFPEMHGTLPEKMVYAAFSRLGIPFLFLNDVLINIPEVDIFKYYQADFVIPSVKLIIEIQGAFWHSKPATIEADAFKFALYQSMGYKALAWWDYDIFDHLTDLITAEPLLLQLANPQAIVRSSELPVERRTKVDTSKGIRTLNARKFNASNRSARIGRRKLRKAKYSYGTK